MLTIFTSPKPFRANNKTIQTNAIQSWSLLHPEGEIILFGNDEGTAEAAAGFKARHIPQVECNDAGTPLISSMFKIAQDTARHPLVGYVNADIILMSDFLPAVQRIPWRKFLLIGRRWDIKVESPLDFSHPDWEKELRSRLLQEGRLHPPTGIDYFVFPRGQYQNIPPFAVGRPGWDNWTIYRTRAMKIPVIDATKAITAVHQNHDYAHHPQGLAGVWQGDEARQNRALIGGYNRIFDVRDATWNLDKTRLSRVSPLRGPCRQGRRLAESLVRVLWRFSGA